VGKEYGRVRNVTEALVTSGNKFSYACVKMFAVC
jgi:hypothetical protein